MKLKRLAIVLAISVAMVATSISSAFACTSLFLGKNISKNGSRYISRTEDMSDNYCKMFGIKEAADHEEGEMYEDTYGFSMPYPAHTYKYSYIRDSEGYGETVMDEDGNPVGEAYAAAGQNEKGVSMTATVSTSYNRNVLKNYDPLVGTGICEVSIPSVVLAVANSARHACEYLGSIIDQYGAGECNSILISDANEAWDFEIVSGHQWVALKLDDNLASFNPNIMLMQAVDVTDTENVICSENLVTMPQQNGFLVTDSEGRIEVAKTYGSTGYRSYNTRILQGLYFLNPEELGSQYTTTSVSNDNPNPFYVTPSWTLDLHDIMHFQAYRGAGSPEDQDGEHISRSVRSIGTNAQTECHIFETRDGYPLELATIQWQCMEDAEFSIFLPNYTALMTEVDESYDVNATRFANVAKGTSMNWNFSEINNLCNRNRANNVGKNVKAYFNDYQDSLIEQQKAIDTKMLALFNEDPEAAAVMANRLSKDLTRQALEMSTSVLAELQDYIAAGDYSEEFVPSAMTKGIMPVYSFPEEGLEAAQAQAKETVETTFNRTQFLKEDWEKVTAIRDRLLKNIDAALTVQTVEANADSYAELCKDIPTVPVEEVIAEMEAATAAAQAAADEADAKAAAAQAAADEAQAAADAAQAAADKAQAELDAAKAELEADEAKIATLTEEAKAAQSAADTAQATADKANADLAKANAETEALKADLEVAKADAAAAKAENAAELAALKEAVEKAQAAADLANANLEREKAKDDVAAAKKIDSTYPAAEAKAVADALAAYAALDANTATKAEELAAAAAAVKDATDKANAAKAEAAKSYAVKGLKVKAGAKKATVTFTKTKGATAYQVQYRLGKKAWKNAAKSTTKAKVVVKKLKKAKKYSFRVRTITKVNGKTVYGKWTKAKTVKIK